MCLLSQIAYWIYDIFFSLKVRKATWQAIFSFWGSSSSQFWSQKRIRPALFNPRDRRSPRQRTFPLGSSPQPGQNLPAQVCYSIQTVFSKNFHLNFAQFYSYSAFSNCLCHKGLLQDQGLSPRWVCQRWPVRKNSLKDGGRTLGRNHKGVELVPTNVQWIEFWGWNHCQYKLNVQSLETPSHLTGYFSSCSCRNLLCSSGRAWDVAVRIWLQPKEH